jgi:hypothetical protein
VVWCAPTLCDRMRLNASKTPYGTTPGDLLLLGSRASAPSIRGDLCSRYLAVLLPSPCLMMSASPGAVNWSGVFILSNEPP